MDTPILIFLVVCFALLLGGGFGWLLGGRQLSGLAAEREALRADRDEHRERFKQAARDLEAADREREGYATQLAALRAGREADARAHDEKIATLIEARDTLAAQFQEVAAKLLNQAQTQFMEQADQRFRASEQAAGGRLADLLAPVSERLQRYDTAVHKVEDERKGAFAGLHQLMESLRQTNNEVKAEAARLSNSLRNAPKARGRWGEQQLRNVLEASGLSEHADFQTEVSVAGEDGTRLRPDVVIHVPGGQNLVVDAKVSLNAYQDAFNAVDDGERAQYLSAHAAAVKAHITSLGAKAYWTQFDNAPDYVVLFIPGEHFLAAALETEPGLWDYAFEKKVLLATPTNLIAIARTVAAVWRQEKLTRQAEDIAKLGKELYARLATMGGHITRLGKNLDTAVGAYNSFVGSMESQVLTQARRFETLDIDTAGKTIDALPAVETATRPQTKLVTASEDPVTPFD